MGWSATGGPLKTTPLPDATVSRLLTGASEAHEGACRELYPIAGSTAAASPAAGMTPDPTATSALCAACVDAETHLVSMTDAHMIAEERALGKAEALAKASDDVSTNQAILTEKSERRHPSHPSRPHPPALTLTLAAPTPCRSLRRRRREGGVQRHRRGHAGRCVLRQPRGRQG